MSKTLLKIRMPGGKVKLKRTDKGNYTVTTNIRMPQSRYTYGYTRYMPHEIDRALARVEELAEMAEDR